MKLEVKLNRIYKIFPADLLEKFLTEEITNEEIQQYYKTNKLAYSLLHSKTNFVHMAISSDGKYKEEDLFEHAKLIKSYINKYEANNILELACGRGSNTKYLAKNFPQKAFQGIDFSEEQLSFTEKEYLPNTAFRKADYHNLNEIRESFDITFVIEALCHSNKKDVVLNQVYNKLKKGGLFIIFDGYLNRPLKKLTEEEKVAKKMVERGMAVRNIEEYTLLKEQAYSAGFKLEFEENVSEYIMPNLYRFERLSKLFFVNTFIAKTLTKFLPFEFVKNAITAYLLPELMKRNVSNYMITVFRKI